MEKHPGCAERCALDPAHRRTMEGSTRALSAVPDVSPSLSTLGSRWNPHSRVAGPRRGPAKTRRNRRFRGLHRCDLQRCQKGGCAVGPTRRGKGTKIMAVADRHGLPVAASIASASPHEVKLVEATLQHSFIRRQPTRLIGDRAYDSDPLDQRLARRRIELIAPHRSDRRAKTQDGRALRRYRRRWKVERLFAWLHNFRRLVTRYEYHAENFLGFVHLACLCILLRHL